MVQTWQTNKQRKNNIVYLQGLMKYHWIERNLPLKHITLKSWLCVMKKKAQFMSINRGTLDSIFCLISMWHLVVIFLTSQLHNIFISWQMFQLFFCRALRNFPTLIFLFESTSFPVKPTAVIHRCSCSSTYHFHVFGWYLSGCHSEHGCFGQFSS